MEWKAETDGKSLRRIVALLLALAVLADRAGGMPFPVRFVVLAILRHAEAIAWEFIAGAAAPSQTSLEAPVSCRDSRAEAARLAYSFRLLALLVAELAAHAPARASTGGLRDFILLGARPLVHAPAAFAAHDTS